MEEPIYRCEKEKLAGEKRHLLGIMNFDVLMLGFFLLDQQIYSLPSHTWECDLRGSTTVPDVLLVSQGTLHFKDDLFTSRTLLFHILKVITKLPYWQYTFHSHQNLSVTCYVSTE